MINKMALIGMALGFGAQNRATELGPEVVKQSGITDVLLNKAIPCYWHSTLYPEPAKRIKERERIEHSDNTSNTPNTVNVHNLSYDERVLLIAEITKRLAKEVSQVIGKKQFPVVIGGDHSMAVGTWGGVTQALGNLQNFGLIWFDAHMDAHTRDTTPSYAIHGMPVALLLGHGEKDLVDLVQKGPVIHPKHLVLVGVRSFESGEAALLKKLGVTIYTMSDIKQQGFRQVMQKALQQVTTGTQGFGVSIDLDGFDPIFVPGVGSPAADGVDPKASREGFDLLLGHSQCKALEIAEFNPTLDKANKTLRVIQDLVLHCGMKKKDINP